MRVLILGATGFVGGYLVRELVGGGDEVWGGARGVTAGAAIEVDACRVPIVPCDVTEPDSIAAALETSRPDAVVSLAGMASPPAAQRDPAEAYRVNALGAVHVLEQTLRRDAGIRILLVTSSEVYGAGSDQGSPIREESPLRPNSLYAASKAAADLAGQAFARSRDADVIRMRPFNHTGPGQRRTYVCADFASQVAAIATGRKEPVLEVGNLASRRDFSDVRDIVRGYVAALRKGRAGEAYNLCAGRALAVGEILRDLCDLAGIEPEVRVAEHRQRRAEVPASWGCAEKARQELDWEPRLAWSQTLSDLLEASLAESKASAGV